MEQERFMPNSDFTAVSTQKYQCPSCGSPNLLYHKDAYGRVADFWECTDCSECFETPILQSTL